MELFLYQIINHVKEGMPGLSLVDENYGQLENIDQSDTDMYPVTFPAVLIDLQEASWSNLEGKSQKGTVKVNVQLLIDCYDDTHYTSGTYNKVRERQLKAKELYKALQEFQCTEETSPLVRVKSRDYSLPGNIKVYETVYSFTLHDESAMQEGAARFILP